MLGSLGPMLSEGAGGAHEGAALVLHAAGPALGHPWDLLYAPGVGRAAGFTAGAGKTHVLPFLWFILVYFI